MKQEGINIGKSRSYYVRKQLKYRTNKFKLVFWSNWRDKLLVNLNKHKTSRKNQLHKIRRELITMKTEETRKKKWGFIAPCM